MSTSWMLPGCSYIELYFEILITFLFHTSFPLIILGFLLQDIIFIHFYNGSLYASIPIANTFILPGCTHFTIASDLTILIFVSVYLNKSFYLGHTDFLYTLLSMIYLLYLYLKFKCFLKIRSSI